MVEPKKQESPVMPPFMDPIMWTVIGVTGFCLLIGTAFHAAGIGEEAFQKWSDNTLAVAFLLGFGFIGGAFKGFYAAVGFYKEKQ